MRKRTTNYRGPNRQSLEEMPEVDFAHAKKNPFAARIRDEGSELIHDGPSSASLEEMPEADFSRSVANPYIARISAYGIRATHGRPKRGERSESTTPRSVRLPEPIWNSLGDVANQRGVTIHALIRLAITLLLDREANTTGMSDVDAGLAGSFDWIHSNTNGRWDRVAANHDIGSAPRRLPEPRVPPSDTSTLDTYN